MLTSLPVALVASIFLMSSLSKVRDFSDFRAAISDYTLLQGLPMGSRTLVAAIVPPAEAAVAIGLLLPSLSRLAAPLAVVFAAAFLAVVGLDSRETISHCGCWGVSSIDAPRRFYVLRAVALLGASVGATAAVYFSGSWAWGTQCVAVALTAPFALLLLEMPTISRVVVLQSVSRGGA